MKVTRLATLTLSSLAVLFTATSAHAQSEPSARLMPLPAAAVPAAPVADAIRPALDTAFEDAPAATAWGIAGYGFGLGIGGRMTLPMADGFFRGPVRDGFSLDVGADYMRFSRPQDAHQSSVLRPSAGLVWTLRVSERFAFYPKVELGWDLGRVHGPRGSEVSESLSGLHTEAIGGLLVSLGPVTVRAESGWGYFKAGLAFSL